MRSKVVLLASGLALLILAPAVYFHFASSSQPPDQQPASATEQVAAAPVAAKPGPVPVVPRHRIAAPADRGGGVSVPDESSSSSHEDYVAERQAQLTQLGSSDDPADLKTILSELNNKTPEIRSAALAAAVQFGSKDAIPALQNEVSWAEDPEEKVAIMNAIKYLQLPSFDEFQANLATSAAAQPPAEQVQPNN